jgi:hypothetical protein
MNMLIEKNRITIDYWNLRIHASQSMILKWIVSDEICLLFDPIWSSLDDLILEQSLREPEFDFFSPINKHIKKTCSPYTLIDLPFLVVIFYQAFIQVGNIYLWEMITQCCRFALGFK